jgi:hypothetical protein
VSPVKYELGFYTPEDAILHSHRRENLKSYTVEHVSAVRQRAVKIIVAGLHVVCLRSLAIRHSVFNGTS